MHREEALTRKKKSDAYNKRLENATTLSNEILLKCTDKSSLFMFLNAWQIMHNPKSQWCKYIV